MHLSNQNLSLLKRLLLYTLRFNTIMPFSWYTSYGRCQKITHIRHFTKRQLIV